MARLGVRRRQPRGCWGKLLSGIICTSVGSWPLLAVAANPAPRALQTEVRPGVQLGGSDPRATVDVLLPLIGTTDRGLLFLNPHLSLSPEHANEGNYGIGYRQLLLDQQLLLGANLFYDHTATESGLGVEQLGWGVEALSTWLDLRVNSYHPLTHAKRVPSLDLEGFSETGLLRFNGYEEPLQGVDYEAGVLIPYLSKYLETRAYVGGFWYNSKHGKDVDGTRWRLEARPTPRLTLQLQLTHPQTEKADIFIGGYVSLPFDLGQLAQGRNPFTGWQEVFAFGQGTRPLAARLTDPVIRDLAIRSKTRVDTRQAAAETVSPVVFVDNSNTGTQSGTNSKPYTTLAQAISDPRAVGGRIFVRAGSGTYTNTNVSLPGNTILWGSGFQELGLGGGTAPILDGNGSTVITLASGNTVQGLTIQNGVNGIAGTGTNPGTVTIRNNTIKSNSNDGINLTPSSGTHTITISNNTLTNNTNAGAEVNPSSSATATVTYSGNTSTGGAFGLISQPQDASTATVTFTNNTVTSASSFGVSVLAYNSGSVTMTASGNTVTTPAGAEGITAANFAAGTLLTATVSNNTTSGGLAGIDFHAEGDAGTIIHGTATGNTVTGTSGAGGGGIVADAKGGIATLTLNASGNTLTSNATGFYMQEANTVDLGGGALGSVGKNRLFSNTTADITNTTGATVSAKNNWFGSATAIPNTTGSTSTVTTSPQLTTDPNP